MRKLRGGQSRPHANLHDGMRLERLEHVGRLHGKRGLCAGRGRHRDAGLWQLRQRIAGAQPHVRRELRVGKLERMELLLGSYRVHSERNRQRHAVVRVVRARADAHANLRFELRVGILG
jgi:hypothetical protein